MSISLYVSGMHACIARIRNFVKIINKADADRQDWHNRDKSDKVGRD